MRTAQGTHGYAAILAVSICTGLAAGFVSEAYARNENPGVLPTNARPHGSSYAEWSAQYWQWVVSLQALPIHPEDPPVHPFLDEGGDCSNGAKGQSGSVWFLAGWYSGGSVVRNCTVPVGKALFFPIISHMDANTFGQTESQLRADVATLMAGVSGVEATIDGVPVQNVEAYRFASPLFTVGPLPSNNWFGTATGSSYQAVADGYYLFLAPLSHGLHTIHLAWMDFGMHEITYNLTIAH